MFAFMCAMTQIWNLRITCRHCECPGVSTQVIRLENRCFYLLNQLINPNMIYVIRIKQRKQKQQ